MTAMLTCRHSQACVWAGRGSPQCSRGYICNYYAEITRTAGGRPPKTRAALLYLLVPFGTFWYLAEPFQYLVLALFGLAVTFAPNRSYAY